MKKKPAKKVAKKVAKKAKKKVSARLRVAGKYVPKQVELDLREFAKNHNVPVETFIRQNQADIINYINTNTVTTSDFIDTIITNIRAHKGKVRVDGMSFTRKVDAIEFLTRMKKKLVNKRDVNVVAIKMNVEQRIKGSEMRIMGGDELEDLAHTAGKYIEEFESDNVFIITSPNKKKKRAKKKSNPVASKRTVSRKRN